MKVYQSWEFCKHINCEIIIQRERRSKEEENILKDYCKKCCKAYQFHDYLQERGYIMDEKQIEELYRLREREGMKEG